MTKEEVIDRLGTVLSALRLCEIPATFTVAFDTKVIIISNLTPDGAKAMISDAHTCADEGTVTDAESFKQRLQ